MTNRLPPEIYADNLRNFGVDMAQGFALELRQLAYTMPAGHEDRLIHLSERMAARSRQSRGVDSRGAW